MNDFPTGDPHCPDCHGTGRYQGLGAAEPCRTCEKKEGDNASIEDALGFSDLVEEMFPGELKDEEGDPIQATPDAAPDLSDPKWDDDSEFKTSTKLEPDGSEWKSTILPTDTRSLNEILNEHLKRLAQKAGNLQAEAFYGPSA